MNLTIGETVRLSYNIITGPEKGTQRTGIGYLIDEDTISAAWSHGKAEVVKISSFRYGLVIEPVTVNVVKEPVDPDWKFQDYIGVPQHREAFERIISPSWNDIQKLLFGGHLEPGDIIANYDHTEIYCLTSANTEGVKGHKLLKTGKWSNRISNLYGITIGYHRMLKEKR